MKVYKKGEKFEESSKKGAGGDEKRVFSFTQPKYKTGWNSHIRIQHTTWFSIILFPHINPSLSPSV